MYGNDPAIDGVVNVLAGGSATVGPFLLNSTCTVTEDPATLTAPPSATDPSWVWLPVTYQPTQQVVVTSSTTSVAVTATNTIQQLIGSFNVTKTVTGAGKAGGYTPGDEFSFQFSCLPPGQATIPFTLADGESVAREAAGAVGTSCTVTELTVPPATSTAFGWDPVQFTVNGVPTPGIGQLGDVRHATWGRRPCRST